MQQSMICRKKTAPKRLVSDLARIWQDDLHLKAEPFGPPTPKAVSSVNRTESACSESFLIIPSREVAFVTRPISHRVGHQVRKI